MIGNIWCDETKNRTPEQNIELAIAAHVRRFGVQPDVVYVPLGTGAAQNGCPVIERRDIIAHHYQAYHREA